MSKAECKCCKEIEFWKKADKRTDIELGTKHKEFARITCYGWLKGERCVKGKQTSTVDTKTFDLNFCPSCRKEGG